MQRSFMLIIGISCLMPLAGAQVNPEAPVHDRSLDDVRRLQSLREGLPAYPADSQQRPNWVEALNQGLVRPRETLHGTVRDPEPMGAAPDSGIVFDKTLGMPHVVFPHRPHTEWLACGNCHDSLFERKRTGRGLGMEAILAGRHCGACHGRVAFSPEGSCYRCHSLTHPGVSIQNAEVDDVRHLQESANEAGDAGEVTPRRRRKVEPTGTRKIPVYPARPQ